MRFVFENFGDAADERVGVFGGEGEEQLGELPVRADGTENFVVLYLAGHDRLRDAFLMQQVDGLAEFAEADPMNAFGVGGEFRRGFFLDGDYRHVDALLARTFEDQKRKAAVAGDKAPSGGGNLCIGLEVELR